MTQQQAPSDFDDYAASYDEALQRGISLSGEDKQYFAKQRILWFKAMCPTLATGLRILDFGCGTGTSTPLLLDLLEAAEVVGADTSRASIREAGAAHSRPSIRFIPLEGLAHEAPFDLVFCNGVFHHIPPAERGAALQAVRTALRPEGLFALWENNPWNPATHLVMARIPFDRDAVKVFPGHARQLLTREGFTTMHMSYAFIFPRFLKLLRPLERCLSWLPLGAQYQVLARKRA